LDYTEPLSRIEKALIAGAEALKAFTPGKIESTLKDGGDPVTEADVMLDGILKDILLKDDEGWLSEETKDDRSRLDKERVWIVDPLDGTREFIQGIPEWCMSIAYVVTGSGGHLQPNSQTDISRHACSRRNAERQARHGNRQTGPHRRDGISQPQRGQTR
jgi:myo-inositol-1(or 4)-monophosphatase